MEPPSRPKATQQTITALHHWTDKLFTFTTTRPADYTFVAGQYARLGLGTGDDIVWRAYSTTSAPHEELLEFYGIVVEGGLFTSRLRTLRPGDAIWIEHHPYGFMTVDRFVDGTDLWMLGTGTGIGPYISILRDAGVWEKFRNLILVHCVRYAKELSYRNELAALQQNPPTSFRQVIRH